MRYVLAWITVSTRKFSLSSLPVVWSNDHGNISVVVVSFARIYGLKVGATGYDASCKSFQSYAIPSLTNTDKTTRFTRSRLYMDIC